MKMKIGALLLLAAGVAAFGKAPGEYPRPDCGAQRCYYIQAGDTAWELAGVKLGNPMVWDKIVADNPYLKREGRLTYNGKGEPKVLLSIGDPLVGLEKLGFILSPEPAPLPVVEKPKLSSEAWWSVSPWWLLLLLVPLAFGGWLWFSRRVLNAPAATAGPAIVPGGVNDESAPARFAEMGAHQRFTILSQTAGTISGVLMVSYANGRSVPRILRDERAYRADVRHEDGRLETLYMLQACGNDLRFGGVSRYLPGPGFSFTADPEIVPAPVPVAVPEPETAPAPAPEAVVAPPAPTQEDWNAAALASEEAAAPAMADGDFLFDFDRGGEGQPILARVVGLAAQKITLTSKGNVLTFRVTK